MAKSSRIRIEAEDAASEVFDQVADKALSRMKDVGDAGRFAIQLQQRMADLADEMRATGRAAGEMAAGNKEAESSIVALTLSGAAAVKTFYDLAKVLQRVWQLRGVLSAAGSGGGAAFSSLPASEIAAAGALGVGSVGAAYTVAAGAGAVYVAAKISEQDSQIEELRNRFTDRRIASQHHSEFYLGAAEELGQERTAQIARETGRFAGIGGIEYSRDLFRREVARALEEKVAADAAAAERQQLAAVGRQRGMDIFARFDVDLARQQRSADLDTRGRAELEMRTRIDAALAAKPGAQVDRELIDSLVKRAGDWAVQQEETAKRVADEKERELELQMRAAEQYQELSRGAGALRRRLMTDDDRRKEEEAELFAMAMQGAIDNWTYQQGLLDIAARYTKRPDVERELRGPTRWDDAPRGGDIYSQSLLRGPGELAPEIVAQQTRKETLREIQYQRRLLSELLAQFRGQPKIVLDTHSL